MDNQPIDKIFQSMPIDTQALILYTFEWFNENPYRMRFMIGRDRARPSRPGVRIASNNDWGRKENYINEVYISGSR
jgi:hypothetical protein